MAGSIIIKGHRYLGFDNQHPARAECSCGAKANVFAPLTFPKQKHWETAHRNWHNEHKHEVWRRLHPEQFQEDRPMYADME